MVYATAHGFYIANRCREGVFLKGRGVRRRILDAATRLFYRQGIKHTGVNQIIEEAAVAKASFYQYFPSKDDLIIACLDYYNAAISRVVVRIVERCSSLSRFFERWAHFIKRIARINPAFNGCPIANIGFQIEDENQKIREKFKDITGGWVTLLRPLFKKSKDSGEIPAHADESALFREIMQINEGALIMWRLTEDNGYLDNLFPALRRLLG
jgi:AcrR family transcriptional regulator